MLSYVVLADIPLDQIPYLLTANDIQDGLVSTMAYWQDQEPIVEKQLWERIAPEGLAQGIRTGLEVEDWVRFVEEAWARGRCR